MNKHVLAGFIAGGFALLIILCLWLIYSVFGLVAIIATTVAAMVGLVAAYVDYRTEDR